MTSSLRRLHWGCGSVCPPDWINADIEEGSGVDLCVDISEGMPLESDSIDYAASHHALQQLDVYAALDALRNVVEEAARKVRDACEGLPHACRHEHELSAAKSKRHLIQGEILSP